MNPIPHVLHGSARAISLSEFYDALRAIMPPRFAGTFNSGRRIGVAMGISGGVDSMALAYLCHRLKESRRPMNLAGQDVGTFSALIVDHGLRPNSQEEAEQVRHALIHSIGYSGRRVQSIRLRWGDLLHEHGVSKVSDLSNFETLARSQRYQKMGEVMAAHRYDSLLLGHHQDDDYESVLMRLKDGQGFRGLRGISAANDIPECHGMHLVHQSGFIDGQNQREPRWRFGVNAKQRKAFRRDMALDTPRHALASDFFKGRRVAEDQEHMQKALGGGDDMRVPPLTPLKIEEGGVAVYRPLLDFPKERLIATCVQNGVPWFEDATNADPTLTSRNAVRHMVKHYTLPVALQKPAILDFSARCRRRVAFVDAQADRWLQRMVLRDFNPAMGTIIMQPPKFSLPRAPRAFRTSKVRRELRKDYNRQVAATLLHRVVSMITPEQSTAAPSLDLVDLLCPSLRKRQPEIADGPKAFAKHGVHFIPKRNGSVFWFLCRAPYHERPSTRKLPYLHFGLASLGYRSRSKARLWGWSDWQEYRMYDNRWWVSIRSRMPCSVEIAPFSVDHYDSFREALGDEGVKDLARRLKRYAPGKIRWTLPAIYATSDFGDLLQTGKWWPDEFSTEKEATHVPTRQEVDILAQARRTWESGRGQSAKTRTLIALPTLGVALPGLHDWLMWEFRYRKVDRGVLQRSMDVDAWEALRRPLVRGGLPSAPGFLGPSTASRPEGWKRLRRRRMSPAVRIDGDGDGPVVGMAEHFATAPLT